MTEPELQNQNSPADGGEATSTAPTDETPIETAEGAAVESAVGDDPSPNDPLAAAISERDELRDQLLRSQAELENYRKRQQREREEERRYAAGSIVRDLLPVLDNLQRAIAAAEQGGTVDDLRAGVAMVLQQATEMLAQHQVQAIPAVGEPFDPNHHEALTQMPSDEHPAMTVLQEVETGYKLHDRVLRPTKAIVSSGPPAEPENSSPE